jgi:cation transport ATPase
MTTACLVVGVLAAAFFVHLAWWRLALPRRQTFALLGIFFGVLAAWLAVSHFLPGRWFTAVDRWQAIHVAIVHTACTLAYVVAYSALEHRSPSMTLLVAVADSAGAGCSPAELRGLLAGVSPVEVRLDAMVHEGMVTFDGDGYRLAPKGRAWATVLSTWRRLLGMPRGG